MSNDKKTNSDRTRTNDSVEFNEQPERFRESVKGDVGKRDIFVANTRTPPSNPHQEGKDNKDRDK